MNTLRACSLDFWSGFEDPEFSRRFPALSDVVEVEWVERPEDAELLVFSCFPEGQRTTRPRDPHSWTGGRGLRLFYTPENVRPDFRTCDFAMSFARELVDPRHLRTPNYLGTCHTFGFGGDSLLTPPADPAAILAGKTRFCAYVQGNRVPSRERFVRALQRHAEVVCAGPSLNNTGGNVDRVGKYALYRECKFAIAFENESAVGYTTEKLPDALLSACVPIYSGDPTVQLDFDPGCFLDRADFSSEEALIERILELDRDDEAYLALLGAERYPAGRRPEATEPAAQRAFFERVVRATREPHAAAV